MKQLAGLLNKSSLKQTSLQKQKTCSVQALQLQEFAKASVFLTECNPTVLNHKYADVGTALEALKATELELRHISEAYGSKTLRVFVKTHLALLQRYLNVKDEMLLDSFIIEELSGYIIEDYSDFTIAEFTLVFRKIKKGNYGLIYARVDPVFILQCFKIYDEKERGEAIRMLQQPEETAFLVEFTQIYYEGAKIILAKTFDTKQELIGHLLDWKGYLCQECRAIKVGDCKSMARLIIDREVQKEAVSMFAVSSWLLCWNIETKI
jgi:hypothetical protein